MIEVFPASRTVVIAVAPIVGCPSVQDIGIRLAGVRIDWQPDGEPAALFDSVSVPVGASVAHCYAASFEYFHARAVQVSVVFVAGVDRGDGLAFGFGRPVMTGRPRVPILFSDLAVHYVIASALRLRSGVDDELRIAAEPVYGY
jgi:hypothetical protein